MSDHQPSARTASPPLKVGVIGIGWAGQQHIKAYKNMDGVELVAVAAMEPELLAVAAYGKILPEALLNIPTVAAINVHSSLLPKYRGLDTYARALNPGDSHAGCTVHLVTEDVDAGEILGQIAVAIRPGDTPDKLAQRVRLATQLGSELSGVMYVLDEPSIGLHQRDNRRLIETLERLRDLGNTVLVVEHDEATIEAADHVVDFGPGAGRHGGHVVAQGTPDDIRRSPESMTGRFMSGVESIATPTTRRQAPLALSAAASEPPINPRPTMATRAPARGNGPGSFTGASPRRPPPRAPRARARSSHWTRRASCARPGGRP